MPRHPGGVWSGPLRPTLPQVILGQIYNGGAGRQIILHPLKGVSRGDPGGPSIYNNFQHGRRCDPPKMGYHGGIGGGGSGTWCNGQ